MSSSKSGSSSRRQSGGSKPKEVRCCGWNAIGVELTSEAAGTLPACPPGPQEKTISYSAERIIDNGSFGIVFQARVVETGEIVAIKKVLQDRRFKVRGGARPARRAPPQRT